VNLLERIDRWAAVSPEAIATCKRPQTLTYGELRTRSMRSLPIWQSASALIRAARSRRSDIAEPEMLIGISWRVKSGRPMYRWTRHCHSGVSTRFSQLHARVDAHSEDISRFSESNAPAPAKRVQPTTHFTSFLQAAAPVNQGRYHYPRLSRAFHCMHDCRAKIHRTRRDVL